MTTTTNALRRRARLLVWATIGWNVIEAVVALAAGTAASSGALVSFGLDAAVETSAASVALWYLAGEGDERGRPAGKLIALSFWALAGWVALDATRDLLAGARPDTSLVGIALVALSALVMPVLARAKRHSGQALGSGALVAESSQTQVCAYLSLAVLAGLGLHAVAGWWWADPVAALIVAGVAAREGGEAWRGELSEGTCC